MAPSTLSAPPAEAQTYLQEAGDASKTPQQRLAAIGRLGRVVDELFISGLLASSPKSIPENQSSSLRGTTAIAAVHLADEPDLRAEIVRSVSVHLDEGARLLHTEVLPALAAVGHSVIGVDDLDPVDRAALDAVFRESIFPLLMPLAVDPGRPFPRMIGGQLNLLVQLQQVQDETAIGGRLFAVIRLPAILPRLVALSRANGRPPHRYLWLEDVIAAHQSELFPGMRVVDSHLFRVLRSNQPKGSPTGQSDRTGAISRLDIETGLVLEVRRWLVAHLHLPPHTVVRSVPPLALADLAAAESIFPPVHGPIRRLGQRIWTLFFGHI